MATAKRSTRVLVAGGLVLSAFGLAGGPWAQATPVPAPGYHWCPGITGTRAGAPPTTGTGITATTGNLRQVRVVRRALGPGESRRRGHRSSHLHRRGRLGLR